MLAIAATAIVLLTTWGGNQYAWGSPQIITLGVVAVLATAGFIAIEATGRRAGHPAARVPEPQLLAGHRR